MSNRNYRTLTFLHIALADGQEENVFRQKIEDIYSTVCSQFIRDSDLLETVF